MHHLTSMDAAFLHLETPEMPMHVGSLMRIEAPRRRGFDFHRDLVAHLAERLPRTRVLRRVLQDAPLDLGHPMWREVDAIDLRRHVLKRRLAAPGSTRQLEAQVAKLHALPLGKYLVCHPVVFLSVNRDEGRVEGAGYGATAIVDGPCNGNGSAVGGVKDVVRSQHQYLCFQDSFIAKRQVNGHLVTVEVGVECRTR